MKTIVNVKVEETVRTEAKAKAEARGMTLRGYIKQLVANDQVIDDEYELVLSRVFSGAVLKKMNQGMTKVAAEAEAKVLVDGLR